MTQDFVSTLFDSGGAANALSLFVGSFIVMIYGTVRLSKSATERFASIPLSDDVEDPRS